MTNDFSADAQAGSKTLRIKHDPVQMGWHVGDRIAIAKTTGNDRGQHVEITGISSFKIDIKDRVRCTMRFTIEITSFSVCLTPLKDSLRNVHWGGTRNIEGHSVEMAAEVINLRRLLHLKSDLFFIGQ